MPRALWTGTISFGLVNVPVRMYSAVQEHDLRFNFVHEKDGSRIGYEKICKKEGIPVPDDEIVKAYEYGKGEWVYLSDEDFEAAQVQGHRTFDISDFVSSDDIDPIFFESTYYLGPQEGAERVYALLARALDESGLAGVGTFVMRDREHLGALRVRDGVITLERMYFADEIREPDGVKPKGVRVEKRELEMAMELIDRFSGEWKPGKYKDSYRDTLMNIIEQKRKGEKVARRDHAGARGDGRSDGGASPEPRDGPQAGAAQTRIVRAHASGGAVIPPQELTSLKTRLAFRAPFDAGSALFGGVAPGLRRSGGREPAALRRRRPCREPPGEPARRGTGCLHARERGGAPRARLGRGQRPRAEPGHRSRRVPDRQLGRLAQGAPPRLEDLPQRVRGRTTGRRSST